MTKKSDLLKRARKALGLNGDSQQETIRKARERLGLTTAELAQQLGKSEDTLLAWLAPEGNAKHRRMPDALKLLLAAAISGGRGRKSARKNRRSKGRA